MSTPRWPTPSACRRTRRTLEAHLDGPVPDDDNATARAHTALCAACLTFQQQIMHADRVLARYAESLPAVPEFAITAPPHARRQRSLRSLVPAAIGVGACSLVILLVHPVRRSPAPGIPARTYRETAQVTVTQTPRAAALAGMPAVANARPRYHRSYERAHRSGSVMLAMGDRRRSIGRSPRTASHKPFVVRVAAARLPVVQVADASAAQSDNVRITITDDVRGFTSTARLSGDSGSTQLLELQADAPVSGSQ